MVGLPPADAPVDVSPDVASGVPAVSQQLVDAVEVARSAAVEEAGADSVGEHLEAQPEDGHAVTQLFAAELPGYRGWRWAVTIADGGPGTPVTISEVVLLPGPDALVAPSWLPWQQRVRAGDLGVGDLLPTEADDPRLVPGYLASDDTGVEEVVLEVGLGRRRVLSREGRLDAAERWQAGERGPDTDMARAAPGACGTCGYFMPLAGSMRGAFGVCGNEYAPADGTVVGVEFGCGAHSDVESDPAGSTPVAELIYDDGVDIEARGSVDGPVDWVSTDAPAASELTEPAAVTLPVRRLVDMLSPDPTPDHETPEHPDQA